MHEALIRELWEYLTGALWGVITEDEAAAEGEQMHSLYLRVKAVLEPDAK